MAIFEVVGAGFDASSDETDDRVIWVVAPSLEYLQSLVIPCGATCHQIFVSEKSADWQIGPGNECFEESFIQLLKEFQGFA